MYAEISKNKGVCFGLTLFLLFVRLFSMSLLPFHFFIKLLFDNNNFHCFLKLFLLHCEDPYIQQTVNVWHAFDIFELDGRKPHANSAMVFKLSPPLVVLQDLLYLLRSSEILDFEKIEN